MRNPGTCILLLIFVACTVGCDGDRTLQKKTAPVEEPALVDSSGAPVVRSVRDSVFKDPRDGRVYKTVKYGNRVWMAENLQYAGEELLTDSTGKASVWAAKDKERCGLYYRFSAALKACPPGWRLATEDDWKSLRRYLGRCGIKKSRERNALGDSVDLEMDTCLTNLRGDSLRAASDSDSRGRPYPDYYGFSAKKCEIIDEFYRYRPSKDASSPRTVVGKEQWRDRNNYQSFPPGSSSEWWACDEYGDPLVWIASDRLERPFRGGKPRALEIPRMLETIRCVQGPVEFKKKDTIDLKKMRPDFKDSDNEILYDGIRKAIQNN